MEPIRVLILLVCLLLTHGCAQGNPGGDDTNSNANANTNNHALCVPGSCPAGQWCMPDGTCEACTVDAHCGLQCLDCTQTQTPNCSPEGQCVCFTDDQCGDGYYCEGGVCNLCGMSDPLHCGLQCTVCAGASPSCVNGLCVCGVDTDCEPGQWCNGGSCEPCNTAAHCGSDCLPCDATVPVCNGDTLQCVMCVVDGDCPGATDICEGEVCVTTCLADGCTTDTAPSGETCPAAKLVGRPDALAGAFYSGDTTGDGDDDNLSTNDSDCWDAKYDNFYRVYLMVGDQLAVTLTPTDSEFDAMMKLYSGIDCEANGDGDLIDCYDSSYDGGAESLSYTATADGWYTVVVDGRMAFTEDHDWGTYNLTLNLTCATAGCCCP